jgi:hypothetical protein
LRRLWLTSAAPSIRGWRHDRGVRRV